MHTSNPVYTVTSYFSITNLIPFSQVHTVLTVYARIQYADNECFFCLVSDMKSVLHYELRSRLTDTLTIG